jgi:hypothetical protein
VGVDPPLREDEFERMWALGGDDDGLYDIGSDLISVRMGLCDE